MKSADVLLLACALSLRPLSARADEITVHAATSLSAPLKKIAAAFHASSGHTLNLVFGNSDEIARSLKEGGQGDVFFSASDESVDALEQAKLLVERTRREVLASSLVIVTPHGDSSPAPASAFDLAKPEIKRIGLVKPESVPVGVYGRRYLEAAGLWKRVESRVVSFENTAALLSAVETGTVDAGIIFKTDAALTRKVSIAARIPPDQGPRIKYALALVSASRQPDPADLAVTYLASAAAICFYEKYGFIHLWPAQ